jgi:hypothetical protein
MVGLLVSITGQSASDTIAETLKLSGDHLKAFESASHLAVVPVVKSLDISLAIALNQQKSFCTSELA